MTTLKHKPLRPPRPGTPAEGVYASLWEAMMAEEWECCESPIEEVLGHYPQKASQREATILASMVTWLGCNVGASILHQAKAGIASGRWDPAYAYLFAWTLANMRAAYLNGGIRLSEFLMAPESARNPQRNVLDSRILTEVPTPTALDMEAVDCLMLWLPSDRGQRFLRQCEREVERVHDEVRRARAAEHERMLADMGLRST